LDFGSQYGPARANVPWLPAIVLFHWMRRTPEPDAGSMAELTPNLATWPQTLNITFSGSTTMNASVKSSDPKHLATHHPCNSAPTFWYIRGNAI